MQGRTGPEAPTLSETVVARAMRLSIVDGATYALMVGFGEAYFLADAIRLGASALQAALVVTLPPLFGGVGALLAVRLLASRSARKPLVVACAFGQALMLTSLVVLGLLGKVSPVVLVVIACVHGFCGQACGAVWSSWFGDLVPAAVRGRYFGRRTRWVHLATAFAVLSGGAILSQLETGTVLEARGAGGLGFAVIFGIAALARLVSCVLLALSPEPPFTRTIVGPASGGSLGPGVGRLLLFGASFQFVVYLASPYFGPYMLQHLGLTYVQYTAASVIVVVAKSTSLGQWGREVDQRGPRRIYGISTLLIALVPLPWLWSDGLAWVLFAQAFSGISWAAYEISCFSLLLESSETARRPRVFATQSALNGLAQLLGGLVGAGLVSWTEGMRTAFAVSASLRFALALAFLHFIPKTRGRRLGAIALRLVGFRPHGGLVHRPIDDQVERP